MNDPYGAEPVMDAPEGTRWAGEWEKCRQKVGSGPWRPWWVREAVELDGHEECCGHIRYIGAEPKP
jgi:hypothetical protein